MSDAPALTPIEAKRLSVSRRAALVIAAVVALVDQLFKYIVTGPLELQSRGGLGIEITPFFDLRYAENRGVSLGMLTAGSPLQVWLLVTLTAAISVGVVVWMWRERARGDIFALALVLGGAIGNIVDRVRLGYVVDYADFHIGDFHPFLIFNLADAAITIGVVLLVGRALLYDRKDKVHSGRAITADASDDTLPARPADNGV